ncbi:DUF4468 domain-containing protein [Mucilaginibacter sabulilitoris]|uniref:DUF4468 domain-containing protein n=1 Tax=Mucilaginibacter sabulilitoris TaxID=1173583 RepID=A0ABZ0TKV9_9SPHI|nr:DUF4468 domain-containing protein [Mucilaginibacter sabulilitoris]WPU93688.1 DUF4468 domain-containing protein [Mucilaginibacter sabulilitoris]
MKNLILLLSIFLISKATFAQTETLGNTNLPGIYTDTVSIDCSKAELYSRAKAYLAKNTILKKDVIQMDDPALGRLIANSTTIEKDKMSDLGGTSYIVNFSTDISVTDGKYKYVINNVTYDEKVVTPRRATGMLKKVVSQLKETMSIKAVWVLIK